MDLKDKAMASVVNMLIKYVRKDFDKNAMNLLNLVEKLDVKKVNQTTYDGLHKALGDKNNNWYRFVKSLALETDEGVLKKLVPAALNVAMYSYSKRMESIEKYNCNVPWAILMDPTAACNLKCKGCWAAE